MKCSPCWRFVALILLAASLNAGAQLTPRPVWKTPAEIASTHFTVTIDGKTFPVMHAALNDYFLNFEADRHLQVTVTADKDDFWAKGVEIQPWRLGIRPTREGRSIKFYLDGAAKISISRPGDYLSEATMLYLFANDKQPVVPAHVHPGLQYFGPGVYHQNIDAVDGGSIYLAPGAVVFGALNIWGVQHVKVFGRGVIVYDGPQNPDNDEGWMHKKNWHCIVMDKAKDVSIEGITCVTRSRTWQIQMKDTTDVRFENIKVIGANAGNANADGMDLLDGTGNVVVVDSFFRAADDIFAMQDSWEGYGATAFAVDGKPTGPIRVQSSVLSTSVSNVVRAGWPEKSFRGGHFIMENSDILHAGIGGCGTPFAVMELWATPHSRGDSGDFLFRDIRMDNWYSLVNIQQQPVGGVKDIKFQDVYGLELPSLVGSILKGNVEGVDFDDVVLGGKLATKDSDIPVTVTDGAGKPTFSETGPVVHIAENTGWVKPHKYQKFEAVLDEGDSKGMEYEWFFGDGTVAYGKNIEHEFPDTDGTLLDGSGRFRVLLHAKDNKGRSSWAYDPIVAAETLKDPLPGGGVTPSGIQFRYYELDHPELADMEPVAEGDPKPMGLKTIGVRPTMDLSLIKHRSEDYGVAYDGYLDVPDDAGYTFTIMGNDAGLLKIDGELVAKTPEPFAQFCGSVGNSVRTATGSRALAKGKHRIQVTETHTKGVDGFRVLWQRAGKPIEPIPMEVLSHERYME
jgi:hypothetical protein